jgi:hypothetical protein
MRSARQPNGSENIREIQRNEIHADGVSIAIGGTPEEDDSVGQ